MDVLHVDLDAFYVSVERRENAALRNKPVIVGGDGGRGVVLSCSYEARAKGVRNGMPSMRAKRLCPAAIFVRPRFEGYTTASKAFRKVLERFTPKVEPISLDEAFCDVSGAHTLYGSSEDIARAIRAAVKDELGLVCSIGGGPSKLVSKVASRAAKPDGVLIVEDPVSFLHPLPIEQLWGVGEATEEKLRPLGIKTIGDLANVPKGVLRAVVGNAAAHHLHSVAWGVDPSRVQPRDPNKSCGAEETFDEDLDTDEALEVELLRLSDRVAARLVKSSYRARTITVKLRLADFKTYTRSQTLQVPTDDVWTIFATARDAFRNFRRGKRALRLLGVTGSQLVKGEITEQLTLERKPSYAEAERAVSSVRKKFGDKAVNLARLVSPRSTGTTRRERP